jgi:hypothetical protein
MSKRLAEIQTKTKYSQLFWMRTEVCQVSSFETMSPAFRSGQSWRLNIFPLVLRVMIYNVQKLSFGTPFTNFSPAQTP